MPTTWNSGTAPGISAAELNRIEAGIKLTDAGVYYKVDPIVTDAPATYLEFMVSMSRAVPSGPYNWPIWGTLLNFNPVSTTSYQTQLLLGATAPAILYRHQAAAVWQPWNRVHVEGDTTTFNVAGHMLIADGKYIQFNSVAGYSMIHLNNASTAYLGWNSTVDTYLAGINKITFYQHGNGGNPFQIDWTMQVGLPVLKWPNNVGVREVYYDSGGATSWYARGIASSELWDRFSGFYSIYNFGDLVGSSVPQFQLQSSGTVEASIKHRGIPLTHRANGIYLGNNTSSRAITVGFQPTHVMIMTESGNVKYFWEIIIGDMSGITSVFHSPARILLYDNGAVIINSMYANPTGTPQWLIYLTTTGFSVGGVGGGYQANANSAAFWHTWVAFG